MIQSGVKKNIVRLSSEERNYLETIIRPGRASAGRFLKARLLLKANIGAGGKGWQDARIGTALETRLSSVQCVRRRLVMAEKIIPVQDNLNTHCKASLYEAFDPAEARRLIKRFEWHFTPKHGRLIETNTTQKQTGTSQTRPHALNSNISTHKFS